MMQLKSQAELESLSSERGLAKLMAECEQAESAGRASGAFYAKQLLERFVNRMAERIDHEMANPGAGRAKAHKKLVAVFDSKVTAFISVSTTLNMLMVNEQTPGTNLSRSLGNAMYNELFCTTFDDANPDLFHTICKDLDKRQSKSSRHRMTVLKNQAAKKGIAWENWTVTEILQVGEWCLDNLVSVGLCETHTEVSRGKAKMYVELSDEALGMIEDTKRLVSFFRPQRLPFVEKPLDWTGIVGGGYHTARMQSTMPRCIKASPTQMDVLIEHRDDYKDTVVACINTLQSVEWRINKRILEVQQQMFRGFEPKNKPDALECHSKDIEEWTETDKSLHGHWKKAMARWYTEQRAERYAASRHAYTLSVAREFADYPRIWFLYFADWRGRYYPATTGISPQGTDISKSMLEFANGKPISDPTAEQFFLLLGSTKFGFDKGSISERVQWVHENHELIMACADEPLLHTDFWYREADKKTRYQFLAWCFEYAEYKRFPSGFVSRLPVSLDGTCNGLQHYSAMLRDSVGAKATNLLPANRPNDIYAQVAGVVTNLLESMSPADFPALTRESKPLSVYEVDFFRSAWLHHGISRSLVKRCVMTLPYGSKKFSMGRFIKGDYMMDIHPEEFDTDDYTDAANFLGDIVWKAIGIVVEKAVGGMGYFQGTSRAITRKKGVEVIQWPSMTGLPIVQDYWKTEYVQFRSVRGGGARLKCLVETDKIDKLGHANGIAPNIVHSLDAAHLTFVTLAAEKAGIDSFAMIHDDYGTHAADTALLFKLIREEFVKMYEQDPFTQIAEALEAQAISKYVPARPEFGDLDLEQVKHSEYFFL